MLALSRWSWRQWLLVQRQAGRMTHRAIVVGNRESVEHLAAVIRPQRGIRLPTRRRVPHRAGRRARGVAGLPAVGDVDALKAAALSADADAVIITSSDATHPDMVRRLGWDLEGHDIEIIVAPSLANIAGPRVHIRPVAGLPLLHVEKPAYRGGARWAKGTLDRVGALALLLCRVADLRRVAIAVKVDQPRRRLLRPGAGRPRRQDIRHDQVPHDGRGRRPDARRAHPRQRQRRDVQDA